MVSVTFDGVAFQKDVMIDNDDQGREESDEERSGTSEEASGSVDVAMAETLDAARKKLRKAQAKAQETAIREALRPGVDHFLDAEETPNKEPRGIIKHLSGETGHTLDDILRLPGALHGCRIHEDDIWQPGNFVPVEADLARMKTFLSSIS